MARGRGGSHDFGVVTRRRYMSVDPELELGASRRTQRLADHMNQDADSMSYKSRNKDRDLLNDITQRLEYNAYVDPVYRSHSRPSHSYTTTTYHDVARKLPESPLFIIAGSRRGGSVPPLRRRIDLYEEDDHPRIKMPPPPPPPLPPRKFPTVHYKFRPGTYRARRAASEPPPYRPPPVYASLPRKTHVREVPYYTRREPYHYYSSGAPYIYSDIPYYRRNMSYLDLYDDEPVFRATYHSPCYAPTHHTAVRNARRHLDSLERELGMQNGPVIDEPVIVHHINTGPVARVVGSSHAPRATYRVAAVPPIGGSYIRHRSSSLPPSPKGVPRRSRVADIEGYYEDLYGYDTDLMKRTVRPYHTSDITASIHPRLASKPPRPPRMPSLDRHRPHQGVVLGATPITPYKPASTHKPPSGASSHGSIPRGSFRPKVSDTRQRIRDVLCATKHDPHYYD